MRRTMILLVTMVAVLAVVPAPEAATMDGGLMLLGAGTIVDEINKRIAAGEFGPNDNLTVGRLLDLLERPERERENAQREEAKTAGRTAAQPGAAPQPGAGAPIPPTAAPGAGAPIAPVTTATAPTAPPPAPIATAPTAPAASAPAPSAAPSAGGPFGTP